MIATIIAPLCEMNAMFPFGGIICENDPFNGVCESVIPKLFGPIILMLYFSPSEVNSSSNLIPSPPISLKPAVITTIFSTPTSPHSFTVSLTKTDGIVIIAKSTFSGMSFIFAYACLPKISPPLGFIGYIFPSNPSFIKLSTMMYPTFPGLFEAPITATDSGLNILLRFFIDFSPLYLTLYIYNDK